MKEQQVYDALKVGREFHLIELNVDMKRVGSSLHCVVVEKGPVMLAMLLRVGDKEKAGDWDKPGFFVLGTEPLYGGWSTVFIGVAADEARSEYGLEGNVLLTDHWAGVCLTFPDDLHEMAALMGGSV